jgi:short chain dehydrogenase
MTRFKDKVVNVTGAGSGIGAGTARRFLQEGAFVVLNGRREEKLHETIADFDAAQSLIHPGDVSDDEERYVACTDVDIPRRFFALSICDKDLEFHVQVRSEPKHGRGYVVDRNSCRRLFEGADSPQQASAECLFKEVNSSV